MCFSPINYVMNISMTLSSPSALLVSAQYYIMEIGKKIDSTAFLETEDYF